MNELNKGLGKGRGLPAGFERRDYVLSDKETVLELNEMVWYPPYGEDTNHCHNCMEIGVCVAGSGTITMGQKAYPFGEGTVVIIPAGLHHSQQNQGDPLTRWRYAVIDERRFMTEIPARCRGDVMRFMQRGRTGGLYLHEGEVHRDILEILRSMFDAHTRHAKEAQGEIEALMLLLLVRAAREPIQADMNAVADPLNMKSIEPSLLYVSENYRQEIRVQHLARACAMSESYFRKVVGERVGISPLEYVNRYRVHRAMHLLHVTDDPVQDVAMNCGFPSVSTFARNFIRYVGQNPSAWRRQHVIRKQKTEDDSVGSAEIER